MKKNLIRLTLFLVVLGLLIVIVQASGIKDSLDKETIRTWISKYGNWAPMAFILLFAVAPVFFFPGLPITLAGGLVFGPWWGTVYSSIGATIGACLAFLVARYFARRYVESLVAGRFQTIDEGIERQGWAYVAVTRLIPIFPFNLLNYAFGLTRIPFRTYALASWIFMLPATAAYSFFGSSLLDILRGHISSEVVVGILLVVLVSSIPLLYRWYQNRGSS